MPLQRIRLGRVFWQCHSRAHSFPKATSFPEAAVSLNTNLVGDGKFVVLEHSTHLHLELATVAAILQH